MPNHRADVEPKDEVPTEDALEQSQEVPPPDDEEDVALDETPAERLEEERREWLDPENRPENLEVSNAGREFDEEGYEEAEKKFDPDAV